MAIQELTNQTINFFVYPLIEILTLIFSITFIYLVNAYCVSIIFGKIPLRFLPVFLFYYLIVFSDSYDPWLRPIRMFVKPQFDFLFWRFALILPPPKKPNSKKPEPQKPNSKKPEPQKPNSNATKYAKWLAYAYILGFGMICLYLALASNVLPNVDDSSYNEDFVLRTGDSRVDYLVDNTQYYRWEWNSEEQRYVQVADDSDEYDSDLDPDLTDYKPYRANTEEEEITSLEEEIR